MLTLRWQREKVARQTLCGPATTKIQYRTESANRDWTLHRPFFCPRICCKHCCASSTVMLKHVKAEQREEGATPCLGCKNDCKETIKKEYTVCVSTNQQWWSRGKWRNGIEYLERGLEKMRVRKKHNWGQIFFFFSFERSVTEGQNVHEFIFLNTLP